TAYKLGRRRIRLAITDLHHLRQSFRQSCDLNHRRFFDFENLASVLHGAEVYDYREAMANTKPCRTPDCDVLATLIRLPRLSLENEVFAFMTPNNITKYVRYAWSGSTSFGIADGDVLHELQGNIFEQAETTGRTLRLADVKLLAPCQPA